MKLPKTKTGLWVVERSLIGHLAGIPAGIFLTEEGANDYAGSCEQEFKDRNIDSYRFHVTYVMYYAQ